MRVAVIGAGPTGLTAAHRLATSGVEVDLFEASPQVGGLARSLEMWGRPVDLGSHVFATGDPRVERLWLDLLGDDVRWLTLRRGVYTGSSVIEYPIGATDVLRSQPLTETVRAGLSLVGHRVARRPALTLDAESWMVRHYGRPLYERFFEQYAVKLWGLPCRQVDAGFAQSLFGESAASAGVERFPYPSLGTGSVWSRMAGELEAAGGRIHLATGIQGLRMDGGRAAGVVVDGGDVPADQVVSSMPLPLLLRFLPQVPDDLRTSVARLSMRSTVLVYLRLGGARPFAANWLYVYPARFRIGRVTNVDAWLGEQEEQSGDDTVVCIELWCDRGDGDWEAEDSELADRAGRELVDTGLVGQATVLDARVVRLPATHPTPALGTRDALDAARTWVAEVGGLTSIGRHGQFGVPGVGGCMEAAFETADRLLGKH